MNEWEELKKEYREIRIPEQGSAQVLEAMARAKRQRKKERWQQAARYATAVAAVLVLLLLPGVLFLSRGFATGGSDCSMEADGWFDNTESMKADKSPAISMGNKEEAKLEAVPESVENGVSNKVVADGVGSGKDDFLDSGTAEAPSYTVSAPVVRENAVWQEKDAITQEILRQMIEANQLYGDTYYVKSEQYPDGFEKITEEQHYYWNEEGLLVIVFEAGTVASVQEGTVEFIIPAAVFSP